MAMDPSIINLIVSVLVTISINILIYVFVIGQYKQKVDTLERDNERQKNKMDSMQSEVDKLLEFKVNAQKFIDNKIYSSDSPLSLTELGKKLIKESGFLDIFGSKTSDGVKVKDYLVSKLEKRNPKTQYDVQEEARALMGELDEDPLFESLKKYAFENGADYNQILRAGAIPLRDYFLEKHQNFT